MFNVPIHTQNYVSQPPILVLSLPLAFQIVRRLQVGHLREESRRLVARNELYREIF